MSTAEPTRTVHVLSTGARICLMIAGLLLVLAGYVFFSGIQRTIPGGNGFPFLCGSAASPPTEDFPKSACGYENQNRQYEAAAYVVSALIIGGGGLLTFGSSSRQELREDTQDEPERV